MVTRLVHTLLSALLGLLSCLPASMRPGLFTLPHPPPSTSSSPAPCQDLFSHFPTSSCAQPCPSCWAPVSLPFSASPALRQWEEQGELFLPLTFLLLVLGSLLLYLAVSLMDPGYVNTQPQPQESKEEQTAMVPQVIPIRRCRYCLVLQPLRARHCRDCRRCVRRYDHHCPWMENCVGERNHPLFVAYLALQLVVLLWGLYLAWSGLRFFQPWGLWLRSSGLLFATFLLLSLLSLVAGLLLASHLYLVASNTTTWEFISSHRIAYLRQRSSNPFDRGLTRNLAHFFCGWPSGSWETLWAEEAEEEGSSQAV